MYYDFTVKIPQKTGKISLHRIKNTTYVHYQYDHTFLGNLLASLKNQGVICTDSNNQQKAFWILK